MEDYILKLIRSLISITEKAKIKWSEGSSENEYYINFEGTGIVIAKSSNPDNKYELRFLKPDGTIQFSINISNSDGEFYQGMEKLFNLIASNSPEAILTIEELIKNIEKKEKETQEI